MVTQVDAGTDDLAVASAAGEVDFQALEFAYRRSADHDAAAPARHPVIVVGAGPVGLCLAIDLAQHGVPVVLLDDDFRLSTGSRAICFAKRTLDIFDRLGCGQKVVDKGVSWNVGRLFFREREIYSFDLLAEPGHGRPAFVNLQQYYVEGHLAERAAALPLIDLRWKNRVVAVEQGEGHALVTIDTPDGRYALAADHLVACDGARSPVRALLGLEAQGRRFRDRFLIVDVKMEAPFPVERWFWFDPPFHPNQSVLVHRQPDGVFRVDFQLGWDADPDEEKKPEHIVPRLRALLGADARFELVWASVYSFSCVRMATFRVGRVLFAGDAAHSVSPFGARGANSGVQDADNLGWKLAAVVQGRAPEALLVSYASEREAAADENIRHSTRATDFITPKSEISRLFRDAVLDLARDHGFARRLVNSGRLSTPSVLRDSPLNTRDAAPALTPDGDSFDGGVPPGAVAADAPLRDPRDGGSVWLLRRVATGRFTALVFGDAGGIDPTSVADASMLVDVVHITGRGTATDGALEDVEGLAASRYDAAAGAVYLLRPDQHVCARWRRPPDSVTLRAALRRALALNEC